jgi:hypothetical protein
VASRRCFSSSIMSAYAYDDDGDGDGDDGDANDGWFYRDVRDVVHGLIHSPSRASGGGSSSGAADFSFRIDSDAYSAPALTSAIGAMRVNDDTVRGSSVARAAKARDAIARAKAAAGEARDAAVRLSQGAAATPPHLVKSARGRDATSPKAAMSPLGPARRVVRRTGAPPDLEIPPPKVRRARDVADSARSLMRENVGRPSQSARERAFWNVTRDRDRAGVSVTASERRALSRGAARAASASEETTLRKLFSIAAKADPTMVRRRSVAANDRTVKEAVEFLSSPTKRHVRQYKPPHPRL